jgi:hypothetical protein
MIGIGMDRCHEHTSTLLEHQFPAMTTPEKPTEIRVFRDEAIVNAVGA